jgi:enamine deaminase RidA (YjgF/YER057c/UK114 family)
MGGGAPVPRVMDSLVVVLGGIGLGLQHVVSAPAYLTHFDEDDVRFNAVYANYLAADRPSARTCIGMTALAGGARIEVDLLARRP